MALAGEGDVCSRSTLVAPAVDPSAVVASQPRQSRFASIRAGKVIDNSAYMASSTLMAILGRMAAYTGQTITWEQSLNSTEDLSLKACT